MQIWPNNKLSKQCQDLNINQKKHKIIKFHLEMIKIWKRHIK